MNWPHGFIQLAYVHDRTALVAWVFKRVYGLGSRLLRPVQQKRRGSKGERTGMPLIKGIIGISPIFSCIPIITPSLYSKCNVLLCEEVEQSRPLIMLGTRPRVNILLLCQRRASLSRPPINRPPIQMRRLTPLSIFCDLYQE